MPSGDSLDVNPNSTLGAEQIKWLTNHLSSLYRKDITEKPTKFHRNISFSAHILSIEKYMKIAFYWNPSNSLSKMNSYLNRITNQTLLLIHGMLKSLNFFFLQRTTQQHN